MIGLALRLLGLKRIFGAAATTAATAFTADALTGGKSTGMLKDLAYDKLVPDILKNPFSAVTNLAKDNPDMTKAGVGLVTAMAALMAGNKLAGGSGFGQIIGVVVALALGWMAYEMAGKALEQNKPAPQAVPVQQVR